MSRQFVRKAGIAATAQITLINLKVVTSAAGITIALMARCAKTVGAKIHRLNMSAKATLTVALAKFVKQEMMASRNVKTKYVQMVKSAAAMVIVSNAAMIVTAPAIKYAPTVSVKTHH